jgi:hypothetical protein
MEATKRVISSISQRDSGEGLMGLRNLRGTYQESLSHKGDGKYLGKFEIRQEVSNESK